jgi:phospholipid-binding lipoprotein MlaA
MDVATYWGIPNRSEDFGLTLDAWGVGSGPYLVLPIFGPSNVRDALSAPVDGLASVKGHIANVGVRNSMTAVQAVSKRSDYLELGDLVDQVALDKYILMRDALQKRRNRAAAELVQDVDGGTE